MYSSKNEKLSISCCGIEFNLWQTYAGHLKNEHQYDFLNCKICGIRKKGWLNLRRHFNDCHKEISSRKGCDETFEERSQDDIVSDLTIVNIEDDQFNINSHEASANDQNAADISDSTLNDYSDEALSKIFLKFILEMKVNCGLSQVSIDKMISSLKLFLLTVINKIKVITV